MPKDYVLVICEKPDAGRKIAAAIGTNGCSETRIDGITVYMASDGRKNYAVCSAQGHLYTLEDPTSKRHIYPVFDVEWMPISKRTWKVSRILRVISKLAANASAFVNSCDYDQEGEVIGYNILRYACGAANHDVYRAKFSTLTADDLRSAFAKMQKQNGSALAEAGRTRHMLDFVYGINLSRALTESVYRTSGRFRNLTIGRVQGPALAFVVDREAEIRSHIPVPFWSIHGKFAKDCRAFSAQYGQGTVSRLVEAEQVKNACSGRDGKVEDLKRVIAREQPPAPFNLGDLQQEAYRLFRFVPSYTLSIAENLYLDALISYPRTSSQKLPRSINYARIMSGLASMREYASPAGDLLGKPGLVPREGRKDDPAHPAIYPTGEAPKRKLTAPEWKVYDLVVKRFLATFAEAAVVEKVSARIDVNGHEFRANGRTVLHTGWTKYYPYMEIQEVGLPELNAGDVVRNLGIASEEKFTQPPPRFNQASLLATMEREQIGTKATRAETIKTLLDRGYVTVAMEPTELGFAVFESMRSYMPAIISTDLTREMERQLEEVEKAQVAASRVIEDSVAKLLRALETFKMSEAEVGSRMNAAITKTTTTKILGKCPLCKEGDLRMIRSRQSGKRFVGCSNFGKGCKASMPLPQKCTITASKKVCSTCRWPIVHVRFGGRRITWKLCINIECPSKKKVGRQKI